MHALHSGILSILTLEPQIINFARPLDYHLSEMLPFDLSNDEEL